MANKWLDLVGILGNVLGLGITGPKIKNSSGVVQIRNNADSGWADIEVEEVLLHGTNGTFKVILTAPAGLSGDITVTLPNGTGSIPSSTGMNYSKIVAFTQASSSPLTLDSAPPANATLKSVRVVVDTQASGGSPTISIGVSGTPALYMTTTENNLKGAGQYLVDPFVALGGSPSAIIATIVTSSQTFTGRIDLSYILA